ncbi:MAG: hypothetical protein ACFFA6_14145 [Promethearchaeota archaeon]
MKQEKIILISLILGTVGYSLVILSLYLPWYYYLILGSDSSYNRYFYINDAQNFIKPLFNSLLYGAIFGLVIIIIFSLAFWKKRYHNFSALTIPTIILLLLLVLITFFLEFERCQMPRSEGFRDHLYRPQCGACGYDIGFYLNLLAILLLISNLFLLFIGFLIFRKEYYHISAYNSIHIYK